MINRTYSVNDINQATEGYEKMLTAFDPNEWLKDEQNIAVINDKGDVNLFQRIKPNVVIGHYFYHSRGRDALDTAKKVLEHVFTSDYDIEVIEGLSPLQKLGARWMNKKLGFKSYGVVETAAGPCEIVIMTKNEWRLLHG